jgi:serine/threonine protein kinase
MSADRNTHPATDAAMQKLACAWFDELVDLDQDRQAQAIAALASTQNPEAIALLQRMLQADAHGDAFEKAAQLARETSIMDWAEHDALKSMPTEALNIGGWTLDSELGRGGMGVVYLAHKSMPGFQLQGALKLMRDSHAAGVLLERFMREQRALSRLTHPGIARLFDVGTSERGPYLVMEYIQGQPLLTASYALDLKARLALFLQVCDAVSFAHQRLIVHRDIKPSNVMVTDDGMIKLMDFGIAKLLDDSAGERTRFAPLTPMYSAPEQRLGDATDVRTDVYGLGLVLFEMLCASTALRFSDATNTIVSADFDKPSVRVKQTPNTQSIASGDLQGELDTIVIKATDSDPSKRYGSVEAFSDDIRRWLDGLPIRARPSTPWQRLRKFVRRNRIAVASAASFTAALILMSSYALWQASRAEAARMQAEKSAQVSNDVRQHFVGVLSRAVEQNQLLAPAQLLDLADDLQYAASKQSALAPDSRRALLLTLFPVAGMRQDYPRMQRYVKELEPLMPGANAEETKQFGAFRAILSEDIDKKTNTPDTGAAATSQASSTQATLLVAKAVASVRSGDFVNAEIYANQAQVVAADEKDPMFKMVVRTILAQVQARVGKPKAAINHAQEILVEYRKQGLDASTPFYRKTLEAMLESALLIGDLSLSKHSLEELKRATSNIGPDSQLSLGIYQIRLSLMQHQHAQIDLSEPLKSVCAKESGARCANAHLWLALNDLALGQYAGASMHLQKARIDHVAEVALVETLMLSTEPIDFKTVRDFAGVEPYNVLRLLWVLQSLAEKSGNSALANALKAEVQARAKSLDLSADGIFAKL